MTTRNWEELTRPVDEVLSPEGFQYGEVSTHQTAWDRRTQELLAKIDQELGACLDRSKVLLCEGVEGEVYMGKVSILSENFIVQEIFGNAIFVHPRKEIEGLGCIEVGRDLTVRYGAGFIDLI